MVLIVTRRIYTENFAADFNFTFIRRLVNCQICGFSSSPLLPPKVFAPNAGEKVGAFLGGVHHRWLWCVLLPPPFIDGERMADDFPSAGRMTSVHGRSLMPSSMAHQQSRPLLP